MTEYNIEKIKELSNEISINIKDISVLLNQFYKLISDIPYGSREWIGKNAEEFVRILNVEKEKYVLFLEELSKHNTLFLSFADELKRDLTNLQIKVEK